MDKVEEFRDIPGYEGRYQVSNLGNVKSLSRVVSNGPGFRKVEEKVLKPGTGGSGYLTVALHKERKQTTFTVHQLVAMAFLGHKPDGYKIVVDHIINDKTDNRSENLQLISNRENSTKDRTDVGVCWDRRRSKWKSQIQIEGRDTYLGHFTNKQVALKVYQDKRKSLETS